MDGTGSMQATPRALGDAGLAALAGRVAAPTYDRGRLRRSIVHLGVGGFHRAHQAIYLDDLAERRVSSEWGERGAGLLPGDRRMADALIPQDCLYTVVERSADGDTARVIGSLGDYVFAPADPERVLGMLAGSVHAGSSASRSPRAATWSTTRPACSMRATPRSGGIWRAARRRPRSSAISAPRWPGRRAAGIPPFTVLSCDNLPGNGTVARTAVVSFARLLDDALAAWIEANVTFPNGMVDRITPQTTDADRAMVAETFGIADAWPVMTEPFKQWVIEDRFCNGRLPLEEVGVRSSRTSIRTRR
jgi:mannitol-1-phosphate/altronate dehydrogenase